MRTWKVKLVRANGRTEYVCLLAESERDAKLSAPDYLAYQATELKARAVSAEEIFPALAT